MAYQKLTAAEIPKGTRQSFARFEKTEEWRLMRADLDKGLKPHEALQAVLSPADKKKYGIKDRRNIVRFIKRYIKNENLPYMVKSFQRQGVGDFIIVQHSARGSGKNRVKD